MRKNVMNVITVLKQRNNTKISLLEKACDDAVKVFNQTIVNLEKASEEFKSLERDIDEEINELTETKAQVTNKISNISKMTTKFKDFLN